MKENETVVPPGLENKIANNRKNMKEKKCKTICKQHYITFVSFIMYSTGKIHKDVTAFLRSVAKHAQDVRQDI